MLGEEKNKQEKELQMTHFLICPKRQQFVHLDVCKKKCKRYDECEEAQEFEVRQMVDEDERVLGEIERRVRRL